MIVDLHAHLPMHVAPDAEDALAPRRHRRSHTRDALRARRHSSIRDWLRYWLLEAASYVANYPDARGPAVTLPELEAGDVGVALSCLYSPLDEFDSRHFDGDAPEPDYVPELEALMRDVEGEVAQHASRAGIARDWNEIQKLIAAGKTAIVHCIEGGFLLGATPPQVRASVRHFAHLGIAYVTLAHLFYRQVATNTAAIPFLPDCVYHALFHQPPVGLTELGWTAAHACAEQGILIDITHMSNTSIAELFDWLENVEGPDKVAVVATHQAARVVDGCCTPDYNLSDKWIRKIAERKGVVGLIFCPHYLGRGARDRAPRSWDEAVALLAKHANYIASITGNWQSVAIGTDMDGFTKPGLHGLERARDLYRLEKALAPLVGGRANAAAMCSGNALRVLEQAWGKKRSLSLPPALA